MNRRELIQGAAAVAVAATVPALPAIAAPAGPPLLSFIAGSDGESDWQWVRAVDKADAMITWMIENHGLDACEENPDDPPEDCDCDFCRHFCQLSADRVKRWDDRTYETAPTPADWLRAGYSYRCNCGADYAVTLGDGGFICPDGREVECEDCHDKRMRAEQHAAECRELASVEAQEACHHANAPSALEAIPECV